MLNRRSNPYCRPGHEEVEIDIFSKDLGVYESMHNREELVDLPTGEYFITGFYMKNADSYRATIYLKKESNFSYQIN